MKNKKQGRGFYYYNNGDIYEGDWDENKRHGKGLFTTRRNGETCKGEFVKDEFTTGVYIDSKGSRYKNAEHPDKPALNGFFKKGRLFGYGRIDFFNGGVYEGLFKDGKRSGHGRMIFVMGGENDSRSGETAEYIGEWKYNLRHGNGKMTWQADGSRYEGLWHMDKRL